MKRMKGGVLAFISMRRFNYIDSLCMTFTVVLAMTGHWGYAIALLLGGAVASLLVERWAGI